MKASAMRWTAWGNAFFIAVATLWTHKLRFTVFGIVIGIAAVVLASATLLSVRDLAVRSTAQSFGVNTFIVSQVASVGDLTRKELSDVGHCFGSWRFNARGSALWRVARRKIRLPRPG